MVVMGVSRYKAMVDPKTIFSFNIKLVIQPFDMFKGEILFHYFPSETLTSSINHFNTTTRFREKAALGSKQK